MNDILLLVILGAAWCCTGPLAWLTSQSDSWRHQQRHLDAVWACQAAKDCDTVLELTTEGPQVQDFTQQQF